MVVILVLVGGGLAAYQTFVPQGCSTVATPSICKYQVAKTQFGAVTEYSLASPQRWANAIAVSADGSVWFGEQALPGVGQLFANGTVTEHAWPNANGSGGAINGYKTGIWGVAVWRGSVWGTDSVGNSIVGYNPGDGSFRTLVLPIKDSQPYKLTPGPDGALWFTSFSRNPTLGRISPNFTVSMYPVLTNRDELPTEIEFANSSVGYYAALDPYNGARSGVYSFDPGKVSGGVTPTRVGGNFSLIDTISLSISPTTLWVEQHLVSSIAGYSFGSRTWTVYPTSTLNFTNTALPYFVQASGSVVWFNEHYANRMAFLNPAAATLTEYSEANPPITVKSQVQNDLTIAASPSGAWFTSTTGNYIGFVDGGYVPTFAVSVLGSKSLNLTQGASATVSLQVTGTWSHRLGITVSDDENFTALPSRISIAPDKSILPSGSGPVTLGVTLTASGSLQPGRYAVAVTVNDGLVYQTAYLFLTVP